jgi:NAD(P)-dependent dehydrogenase (short-subunit alcohol dehydrogenase family)
LIGKGSGRDSLRKRLTMQKIILLTGTEDRFRLATALVLAQAGHIVYADLRRAIAASAEISALARREDIDLRPVLIDAASPSAIAVAVGSVLEATGRLDVLIHSAGSPNDALFGAGIVGQRSGSSDMDMFGMQAISRIVGPIFQRQREGLIMWISRLSPEGSMWPYLTPCFGSACDGSAADSYARELAHAGIECCTIVPRCTESIGTRRSHVSPGAVADAIGAIVDLPPRKRPFRVTVHCKESRCPERSRRRAFSAARRWLLAARGARAGTHGRNLQRLRT